MSSASEVYYVAPSCGYCDQPSTVTVDGTPTCRDHHKTPPPQLDRIEAMLKVLVNRRRR